MTKLTLEEALAKLDPTKPEQWTAGGVPMMDVLIEWTGAEDGELTRKMVTAHSPKLTRESLLLERANNPPPQKNDLPKEEAPVDETPLQISSYTTPAEITQMFATATLPQIRGAIALLQKRLGSLESQKTELDAKLASTQTCVTIGLRFQNSLTPKETFSQGVRAVLNQRQSEKILDEEKRKEALKVLGIEEKDGKQFLSALAGNQSPIKARKNAITNPQQALT